MLTAHPNYGMSFASMLPDLPLAEPNDISDAVPHLASELSRAVTGTPAHRRHGCHEGMTHGFKDSVKLATFTCTVLS